MELDLKIILFLPLVYYFGVWIEPYNAWAITLIMAYCVFFAYKEKTSFNLVFSDYWFWHIYT